jgi:hypothetical protein
MALLPIDMYEKCGIDQKSLVNASHIEFKENLWKI